MSALATSPAQFTFGPSFSGALYSGRSFVDTSNSRRYEIVPAEEIARFDALEDKILAVTAELVRSKSSRNDFETWDRIKRELGL